MCQFVAILIHLFLCRYECQNFGFWGAFLAGRFCVYITQMNFHFYRFSALFALSYLILFYRFSVCFDSFVLIRFYRWFVLFVLLYFVPIVSRGGVVSLLTRCLMCHVNELPHYHVNELPYYLRLRFEVSKTCHIICAWRFEDLPRCEVVLRSKILQLVGCSSTTARRGC